MPTETELKLTLEPGAIGALLCHPALRAAKAGRARRARLVSTYHDTPAFALAGHGVALRLRRDGSRWVQTVKGPPLPSSAGVLVARDEHEWALRDGHFDAALLGATPWSALLARIVAENGFGPRFVTDFERRTVPLRLGAATRALLCIDRGVIRTADGLRERDISELEIEIVDGDPIDLFVFAATLAADLPLSIALAGKAARGIALVQGKPDGWDVPVRAEALSHPPDASAADALSVILRECVRQLAANAPGLLADANPEWVHQMRIGTRRLRACLGLVAPLLPAPGVESLVAEVRWLAGTLGAIRDLDVFAEGILQTLAQALNDDVFATPALARLRAATRDAQQRRRDDARRAVASARFTRLVLAASALAAVPRFGVSAATGPADTLGEPAGHYAAGLMRKRHARLLRRMRKLKGGRGDEWHAVRIATKKTRYVAEFFAGALAPNKRARAFIDALAGVQDALGEINDAAAATRLAGELAGDAAALAVGAGAVHAWVAARREMLEATLTAATRRYRKAEPFWHRS